MRLSGAPTYQPPGGIVTKEEKEAAIQSLITSDAFCRAPSLCRFLSYVCGEVLAGRGDSLKEYSIAVEALGRPAEFDPKRDSIVRVQALKLRKRLQEYYASVGNRDRIRITFSEGSYIPEFSVQEAVATAAVDVMPEIPHHGKHPLIWTWIGAAAIVILLLGGVVFRLPWFRQQQASAKSGISSPERTMAAVAPLPEEAIRILAGRGSGRHRDEAGDLWEGDRFYSGGTVFAPPPSIRVRGFDPDVFAAGREGNFSYDIPLSRGLWELRLLFAETEYGQDNLVGASDDRRMVDIYVNSKPVASRMDLYVHAGEANTADELIVPGVTASSDGMIHIRFDSVSGSAQVNAIELVKSNSSKLLPVRWVCSRQKHRDPAGNVWAPDRFVRGGQLVERPYPAAGTDPELCRGERYGRFQYEVPVAPGLYTVNLYFSEGWFGSTEWGAGGIGSRNFDVAVNHQLLLRNFDVLRAAGGSYRAVKRSFPHIPANRRDKIVLDFEPVVNYAEINALEIVPE